MPSSSARRPKFDIVDFYSNMTPAKCTTGQLLALVLLALQACGPSNADRSAPVATVGGVTLRKSQIAAPPGAMVSELAVQWINRQVLNYHSRGYNMPPIHRAKALAEDLVLRLRARSFLDSLVRQRIPITDRHIEAYYAENADRFLLESPAAVVLHLGFTRESAAIAAAESLASVQVPDDSLLLGYNVDLQLVRSGQILPELDAAIFSADLGQMTGPVVSQIGYHLVLVNQLFNAGEMLPVGLVRSDIIHRLIARRWQTEEAAVLDSLRGVTSIEVFLD